MRQRKREGSVNPRTGAVVAPMPFPRSDGKHGVESLKLRSRMQVPAGDRIRTPPSLGRGRVLVEHQFFSIFERHFVYRLLRIAKEVIKVLDIKQSKR